MCSIFFTLSSSRKKKNAIIKKNFICFFIFAVTIANILIVLILSSVSSKPQVYFREYLQLGCPEFNQYESIHLPHPVYCGKYLTCLSKSVIEQSCPGDLHWNIEKNMCDYPHSAKCEDTTTYYSRTERRSRY